MEKSYLPSSERLIVIGRRLETSSNRASFCLGSSSDGMAGGEAERRADGQAGGEGNQCEEETGVKKLQIRRKLSKTYHIFKRNDKYKLKITHWFEMTTTYDGPLHPQANEGIEKAVWLNPAQVREALKNSYENIKLLFEEEKVG